MSDPQKAVSDPRPSMLAIPIPKPSLPKHLQDEATVTMLFPRALSLNLDEYLGLVHFEKGLQEVPVSLATDYPKTKDNPSGMHWYLYQQGVQRYEPPKVEEPDPQELAAKLRAAGFEVNDPKTPQPTTTVDLADMTKAQIVNHAFEVHGLELDGSLKKDELIAAVEGYVASKG